MILITSPPTPCHSAPDIVTSTSIKVDPVKEIWIDNEPGHYDVLCNRGRRAFQSIGNRRFRLIIENHASRYDNMKVRAERSMMVISIVKVIENAGGNFLKQTGKKGTWGKASRVQAKEKVGHALRAALSARKTNSSRTIYDVLAVDEELDQDETPLPKRKKLRTLVGSASVPTPKPLSLGDALAMTSNAQQVNAKGDSSSSSPELSIAPQRDLMDEIFCMDDSPSEDVEIDPVLDDNLAESTDNLLSGILDELDALARNDSIFGPC